MTAMMMRGLGKKASSDRRGSLKSAMVAMLTASASSAAAKRVTRRRSRRQAKSDGSSGGSVLPTFRIFKAIVGACEAAKSLKRLECGCLEGFCSTIELHPHVVVKPMAKNCVGGKSLTSAGQAEGDNDPDKQAKH